MNIKLIRIGNLLKVNDCVINVASISGNRIRFKYDNDTVLSLPVKYFQEIPLSEGILKKMGFIRYELEQGGKCDSDSYFCDKKHKFPFSISNISFTIQNTKCKLRSVSHLQNIYLDFVGEEIVIEKIIL